MSQTERDPAELASSAGVHNIRSYAVGRQAFTHPDLTGGYEEFLSGNILDGVVEHIHGDAHKTRRRFENPLFRREALSYWETSLMPKVIAKRLPSIVRSASADIPSIGNTLMLPIAADLAGIDFNEDSDDESSALLRYSHIFSYGAGIYAAARDTDEVKAEVRAALSEFDDRYYGRSRERRARLIEGDNHHQDLPQDILTALLLAYNELKLDPGLLLRETAFFFESTLSTSTDTLTHTMHLLFRWREEHPSEWASQREDLHFIQRCVQEALRLHPAFPCVLRRRAQTDLELAGRRIKKGDLVLIDMSLANRDRSVFGKNAAEFDPNRTLPDGVPPYGLGFAAGVHTCIGRTMAAGVPRLSPGGTLGHSTNHFFGLITLMVDALIRSHATKDRARPPVRDPRSRRSHVRIRWMKYPIVFSQSALSGV